MIRGRYRDVVANAAGHVVRDSGWRCNVIARTAWPLVAALLRNDASLRGVLFCAVGEGETAWDAARPLAEASATRLRAELQRRPLDATDFAYLDIRGRATQQPTDRLEITARFTFSGRRVLREFGLFGGNATTAANSGYLVNYVIHEPVELAPGQSLTRRVRLSLRPASGELSDAVSLPRHWLEQESAEMIDGVGAASLAALQAAKIATIGELAVAVPVQLAERLPLAKAVELRAKARLAIRTAARIPLVTVVNAMEIQRVMEVDAETLSDQTGASIDDAEGMQERLGLIQLALDAKKIRRMTVAELRG